MSKVLCRGAHAGNHIVMAVDRDGYAKDLPDNMPATILYGQAMEIRGTVMLMLEDEKYNLKPIKGVMFFDMCIKMLNAATGGLTRFPTDEELKVLEPPTDDAFEEYDDPSFLQDDDESLEQEEGQEEMSPVEEDEDVEPKDITVKLADVDEVLETCNLCRDTLLVVCPNDCGFSTTNDLMYPIKDAVEKNIKRHGGYMIDEWQYVDCRQVPTDIRSRVRFKLEGDEEGYVNYCKPIK